jgi:hypothetical protein
VLVADAYPNFSICELPYDLSGDRPTGVTWPTAPPPTSSRRLRQGRGSAAWTGRHRRQTPTRPGAARPPSPAEIDELEAETTELVKHIAPSLLAICGCGPLTAAKILGETAGVDRFRSKHAYARHTGPAPLLDWSSNRARHRLSRTGNRQLNAALHRIAITRPPGTRGSRHDRPTQRRRRWRHGSPAHPQTPTIRCRLPRHDHRRMRSHRTGHRMTKEQGTLPPPAAAVKWLRVLVSGDVAPYRGG